jgi:hypothetical protein
MAYVPSYRNRTLCIYTLFSMPNYPDSNHSLPQALNFTNLALIFNMLP